MDDDEEDDYLRAQRLLKDFIVPQISVIQRALRIGFNRASRIRARLETFAAESRAAQPLFRQWNSALPPPDEPWVLTPADR